MFYNIALFVLSFAALASLGYEKTCVLFNVAALASQIASEQNLDNDEALKVAAKYYQVSTYSFSLESLLFCHNILEKGCNLVNLAY